MKLKAGWIVAGLIASFVLGLAWWGAAKVKAAEAQRIVRVGVYDNKPKVYKADDGVIAGFFPDLLEYIALQEDWQINYVHGTWEEGLERLETGEIDIMVDVAYSKARAERFDLTNETVLSSWGVIYVRKDDEIDSFADLDGKKVAVLKEGIYYGGPEGVDQYIKAFNIDVEFVDVDQYADVFELLEKREVDGAVVSRIFGAYNERDHPTLRATDMVFSPTELRFALTKGDVDNPYLIEKIDTWMKRLKAGHEMIYKQALRNNELLGLIPREEVVPKWVPWAGAGAIALILISWLMIVILRQARKTAVLEAKERSLLLSNVVEHAKVVIFALDKEGVVTMAEGMTLENLGFDPKQTVGRSIFEMYRDNDVVVANVKRALAGEASEFRTEMEGSVFRVTLSPVSLVGRSVTVVGVAVDMTEEARLEKAKMEFVSLASHHLRTPPTVVKWGMELIGPKIMKDLGAKELELWKGMEEANERMINLANSLSKSTRIDVKTLPVKPEEFNLAELVEHEVADLNTLIEEKKLKVGVETEAIEVYMDRVAMKTVVETLLTNAVKYTPRDGKIKVNLKSKDGKFVFEVSDTGLGIPKYQQDKVFSRLFRGDNVIKLDPSGVGLGLHISKLIVDGLGGKIGFESEENKGSKFYVEMAISKKEA